MQIIDETSAVDGIDATCDALGVCRATYFRWKRPKVYGPRHRRPPPRALLPAETQEVLDEALGRSASGGKEDEGMGHIGRG